MALVAAAPVLPEALAAAPAFAAPLAAAAAPRLATVVRPLKNFSMLKVALSLSKVRPMIVPSCRPVWSFQLKPATSSRLMAPP